MTLGQPRDILRIVKDRELIVMENLIGKKVFVEGYGTGVVLEISKDDDYPIIVEFADESLHESDKVGYFQLEQINIL